MRYLANILLATIFFAADVAKAQDTPVLIWHPRFQKTDSVIHIPGSSAGKSFDDSFWDDQFVGAPGIDGFVRAMAVYRGDVIAGGEFSYVGSGSARASNVGRWDGQSWTEFGGGLKDDGSWSASGHGRIHSGEVYELHVSDTLLYAGGQFDTAGDSTVANVALFDGTKWHSLGAGVSMSNSYAWVTAIAARGDDVFVGGRFDQAGADTVAYVAHWDGEAWHQMGDGFDHWVEDIVVDSLRVVAVGYRGEENIAFEKWVAEWDGEEWISLADNVRYDNNLGRIDAVTIADGQIYAAGLFSHIETVPANSIARWDGERWHALGDGVDSNIWRVEPYLDGIVAAGLFRHAGGKPTARIAYWDGEEWHPFSTGVAEMGCSFLGRIDGLAVQDSLVHASGCFSLAGGTAVRNVATWDGRTWLPLGHHEAASLSSTVSAIAIDDSLVYVGGRFTLAGDQVANGVAIWDGSEWAAMPNGRFYPESGFGVDLESYGEVRSIAALESGVFIGGSFGSIRGVKTALARWTGEKIVPFGQPADPEGSRPYYVEDIAEFKGELYVAGRFLHRRSYHQDYRIMRWNGTHWRPLEAGVSGDSYHTAVRTLFATDSLLFVGGTFSAAGGHSANGLAAWDGEDWHAMEPGIGYSECCFDGSVSAFAWFDNHLFVAGDFDRVGSKSASNLARWDGHVLTPVRNRSYSIDDLAADGHYLYAVGDVMPDHQVARWDGEAMRPLGSGIQFSPKVVAATPGHVYFGGSFVRAGGKPSAYFADWQDPVTTSSEAVFVPDDMIPVVAVYPNPFSTVATVQFDLPRVEHVAVDVYSVLGARVLRLANQRFPPGRSEVAIHPEGLVPGTYFVRVRSSDIDEVVAITKTGR